MKNTIIKGLALSIILSLSTVSCVNANDTKVPEKDYTITGTSNMPKNTLIILSRITDVKLEIIDSVYTNKKGSFSFQSEGLEESSLYYVTFKSAQPPGIPLILEQGAKIKIDVDETDAYHATFTGGKYNTHMKKLYDIYTDFEKTMVKFNKGIGRIDPATATEETRNNTTARYNKMVNERRDDIKDFIKTEPASPATYFAVKYLFQKPVPEFIIMGRDKLNLEMPNTTYAKNLTALALQLGPSVEGTLAPDINLKTPDGQLLKLSSLRGKVVLIDFWASWCGPCRKENPNVKRIYEKYKNEGFEIYAVSLDNNAGRWKAAIAKDGLTWKHVSDLAGWKSSAAKLYGVHSIPQTFLIDKEGRIIKSGLRSHQLEAVLESIL